MPVLKGKVTSAKEQASLVWLHISGKAGAGWVAISQELFDNAYKEKLVRQLYYKYNRDIKRKIAKLERQIRILKKEKRGELGIKEREHQIHYLKSQTKKELHISDLEGKRVTLRMD